jgi:hypothetical protein
MIIKLVIFLKQNGCTINIHLIGIQNLEVVE